MSTLRVAGSGKNITKLLSTVSSEVNDSTQGAILGADDATIRDLALEVTLVGGTGKSTGIFQGFSSGAATIQDVSIKISSSSSGTVQGIYADTNVGTPISNVDIDVSGANARGINGGSSVQTIDNSSISVSGTFSQIAVAANFNFMVVRNSVISSPEDAADAFTTGALRVSDSIIDGLIDGTNTQCSFVFESDGTAYSDSCQLPPP
ncbi:MAG: hypothetical protein P8I38_14040 [Arenicella sp.]|jgi:hypothetical protein|nr:hypothetical protein [Arenicella sp.]